MPILTEKLQKLVPDFFSGPQPRTLLDRGHCERTQLAMLGGGVMAPRSGKVVESSRSALELTQVEPATSE